MIQGFRSSIAILAVGICATGCGRMVNVEYQATSPLKGQGIVKVVPFLYEAAEAHRARPRQVETNRSAQTELYLSEEIGGFYTEALKRELTNAGYTLEESGSVVSGAVARFFIDWREDIERVFELRVVYTVGPSVMGGFSWECSSIQRGPNTLAQDSVLIRKGTADCIHRFIQAAQDARVL